MSTTESPFNWNNGQPSIFADPSALRYAKAHATVAQQATKRNDAKPKQEPRITKRRPSSGIELPGSYPPVKETV